MPELDKKSPVCPDCLACGFPFWEQLTPEEQEFLCRTTRPVKYKRGAGAQPRGKLRGHPAPPHRPAASLSPL